MLGLDVETLLFYSSSSFSSSSSDADPNATNNNSDINNIADMIELAKGTPVLLMYEPGVERAGALMAAWQLMKRRLLEEGVKQARNAAYGHGYGPGYVLVRYVSVDVVPLIDYWPPFVRDGFAGGGWRFVSVFDDHHHHHKPLTGVDGDDDERQSKGHGSEERVVFEMLEFSLGVMEWLMEMETEAGGKGLRGGTSEDSGERTGMWGPRGQREDLGESETEGSVRGALGRLRI